MAESVNGVDDHVYLDARSIGNRFEERFPYITQACRAAGIDPAHDLIPVSPAAHYTCGGIVSNMDGTTDVEGLYAVGEVAYTGVHGANRLASNSLTESLVVGTRVGRNLAWRLPDAVTTPASEATGGALIDDSLRAQVRTTMSKYVGVLRSPDGLAAAIDVLSVIAEKSDSSIDANRRNFEATNMLSVALAVSVAALERTESRGCHRRTDVTVPLDRWRTHLDVSLHDGELVIEGIPS
jgi:L-aspartate oxidase